MNSKVTFGQYYKADSFLHRLDPRTKIISILVLMVSIFLINNVYILLGLLASVLVLICFSKVPLIKFLNSLKMMAMLLLFSVFFQVCFNNRGVLLKEFNFNLDLINTLIIVALLVCYVLSKKIIKKFRFLLLIITIFLAFVVQYYLNLNILYNLNYQISIYDEGLLTSSKIVLRIISILFMSSLLTLTTKPNELNNGLEKVLHPLTYLKIKVGIFSMMISIALRFIPTLINEAEKILKAQASRGVDFKEGKLKDKIFQIVSLLIPMFVIAFKRAEDLADAMEVRGYIPDAERTKINKLQYHVADFITYAFSLLFLGGIIFLKVKYAI